MGAGNGYFTLSMAKLTNGRVSAVDIEPKMLALLNQRALESGIHNIDYVESDLEAINLPDQGVMKILAAFVLHEVANQQKAIQEMKRILQPAGRILILEWGTEMLEVGPPAGERLPADHLKQIVEKQGLKAAILPINEAVYGCLVSKSEV
ncbi:methyltransferase domain-containing protein [Terrilactibacillus sp. S3-3]|nr:methyltransferase domain-containing protein [Terrilactibacillus sp. S3-3]